MFKRILVVLLVLGVLLPLTSSAQTADEIAKLIAELSRQIAALKVQLAQLQGNQTGSWCFTFDKNLRVGDSGKEVAALHRALAQGGFTIPASDKFTEATAAAVSGFQLKYKSEILTPLGLANPTGYVGPSTRAVLNRLYGCLGKKPIDDDDDDDDRPIIMPPFQSLTVVSPNGGESWQKGTGQLIQWSWGTNILAGQTFTVKLTPYFGVACPVDVTGNDIDDTCLPTSTYTIAAGISGTNYKWEVGKSLNQGVIPSNAYVLSVCVDGTNLAGYDTYPFFKKCDGSDSYFKIYDQDTPPVPGNLPPSISGVSGPTALKINEAGTWTVQASDPENGALNYSVLWGDEIDSNNVTFGAPIYGPVQQTATFTHSYAQAGTYYPRFTVTDSSGQSNQRSLVVNVGVDKTSFNLIYPNGKEVWTNGTTQDIKWDGSALVKNGKVRIVLTNNVGYSAHFFSLNDGYESILVNVPSNEITRVTVPGDIGGRFLVEIYGDDLNSFTNPNYSYDFFDQSDGIFFIKDSGGANRPPSISGVSGPTALKIGETGTWTVQASDPENGPLSYSVIWGDEAMMADGSVAAPMMEKVQQTATFTHSYSQAGTYYPKFKVTDNAGQSNGTSISVVAGGQVIGSPIKVIFPNDGGGINLEAGSTLGVFWSGGQPDWKINIFLIDTRPDYYTSNSPILISNTANDGREYVFIPTNIQTANAYKIRVACQSCATGTPGWTDDSDGIFPIVGTTTPTF